TIVTRADTKYLDAIERLTSQKIEWHDGDLSTVVASEEDDAPRRGRGAPRRAGRKDDADGRGDRRRGRGRDSEAKAKAAEPVTEIADAPAADAAEERRARKDAIKSDNADRGARSDRPAKPPREDRPRRDDKRRHRDDDINDGTVGFGDDMPAFMKIAAKV